MCPTDLFIHYNTLPLLFTSLVYQWIQILPSPWSLSHLPTIICAFYFLLTLWQSWMTWEIQQTLFLNIVTYMDCIGSRSWLAWMLQLNNSHVQRHMHQIYVTIFKKSLYLSDQPQPPALNVQFNGFNIVTELCIHQNNQF